MDSLSATILKQPDALWTPGRVCGLSTPPPVPSDKDHGVMSPGVLSRVTLDSPPEAAIEATPDSTPYATPIKVQ